MSALRIALPKGRVCSRLVDILTRSGLTFAEDPTASRKLIVPTIKSTLGFDVEVLLLKNADVPVYVEHGVADIGVAGTDLLRERPGIALYRPFTFGFGGCRIVLAGRRGETLEELRRRPVLHVATKYVHFAREHFAAQGWSVEIIPLSGSVELAPVLGLADAIVDLTETGETLRENGLVTFAVIGHTHLKLVVNQALTRASTARVEALVQAIRVVDGETGAQGRST